MKEMILSKDRVGRRIKTISRTPYTIGGERGIVKREYIYCGCGETEKIELGICFSRDKEYNLLDKKLLDMEL
jgi:hypothetical protein